MAGRSRRSEIVLDFDPSLISRLTQQTEEVLFGKQPDGGRALRRAVRAAWNNELTDCQKRCLDLYYRERHTMKEIAQIRGVSVPTVSRTLRRARNRLRRVLQYYVL